MPFPIVDPATLADEPAADGWSANRLGRSRDARARLRALLIPMRVEEHDNEGFFYTIKRGADGHWAVADGARVSDPDVEEVFIATSHRRVYLAANGSSGTDSPWCAYGREAAKDRPSKGYTVCNSNFTVTTKDDNMGFLMEVDRRALMAAVREAGLIQRAEQAVVERRALLAQEQAQSEREQQQASADARALAAQFRERVSVGDTTHCGLVVEVKRPVVKVQTQIGEHWLKVEQLYPAGLAQCRFLNGVYQNP